MEKLIRISKENIDSEHICCAFSDKKCTESYQAKKDWLKEQFEKGYVFERLDARAKVFIEYAPAENAWLPVIAPDYMAINCFWVSGKYKGNGFGKKLLAKAISEAREQGKKGVFTVVGTKKFHFMSDTKFFLLQGFTEAQKTVNGFSLLAYKFDKSAADPCFSDSVLKTEHVDKTGLVVYYSNRCPYAEFHVEESLPEAIKGRGIPLKVVKLDTQEKAENAPSPATVFSLFYKGEFVTTDLSICLESRFEKLMAKAGYAI